MIYGNWNTLYTTPVYFGTGTLHPILHLILFGGINLLHTIN